MNTGHAITTEQYLLKLKKLQKKYIEEKNWVKVRSLQFKMDNANYISSERGNIQYILNKFKTPNRKERRKGLKKKEEQTSKK